MKELMDFLRKQGAAGVAAGVAAGFVLGGAISKLIETFVVGIVDPAVALLFDTGNLTQQTTRVGEGVDAVVFSWGAVIALLINLILVSAVLYYAFNWLKNGKKSTKKTAAKSTSRKTNSKK